jgi:N-acetylmuramoyl-L-alanine amidase
MNDQPLAADSPHVTRLVPSPNFDDRRPERPVDVLVLHYTGMATPEAAIERLADGASPRRVSCHYVALEDGGIVQMVPEAKRAWHAGAGRWKNDDDINAASIGIEIVNRGHDFDYPDFPDTQIAAVIALCRDIVSRNAIHPTSVIAHSDMAPSRKIDPGEKFPWERLNRAGIGHWVPPSPIIEGKALRPGDVGAEVEHLQTRLNDYGFDQPITGEYDAMTVTVVRAFQRHFRPALIDGIADASTCATLDRLIATRPRPNPPR